MTRTGREHDSRSSFWKYNITFVYIKLICNHAIAELKLRFEVSELFLDLSYKTGVGHQKSYKIPNSMIVRNSSLKEM